MEVDFIKRVQKGAGDCTQLILFPRGLQQALLQITPRAPYSQCTHFYKNQFILAEGRFSLMLIYSTAYVLKFSPLGVISFQLQISSSW